METPVIGHGLYRLNTLPSIIRKTQLAGQRGARFASAGFVTGSLAVHEEYAAELAAAIQELLQAAD